MKVICVDKELKELTYIGVQKWRQALNICVLRHAVIKVKSGIVFDYDIKMKGKKMTPDDYIILNARGSHDIIGSRDNEKHQIWVNRDQHDTSDEILRTIIHEIGHAINLYHPPSKNISSIMVSKRGFGSKKITKYDTKKYFYDIDRRKKYSKDWTIKCISCGEKSVEHFWTPKSKKEFLLHDPYQKTCYECHQKEK